MFKSEEIIMESKDNIRDAEQQSATETSQTNQALESDKEQSETANSKIQELTKFVKDMYDQNSSGQLSSELCMQIFVIIEELNPLFNEMLKVDMGKCLEKIRKALRKDKFESKDQDSSKSKGSFKTLFKSSKNGLCYEAIDGYITVLVTKTNEGHGDLYEQLKVLSSVILEQNNSKKPSKKEKSSKSNNSDQPLSKETSVEEPVINQSSAEDLQQIESSLTSKSEVDLIKISVSDDKVMKDDPSPKNCQHLSDTQSINNDDVSFEVQVSTEEQSTEAEPLDPLSKQHGATPEPLEASTEQSLATETVSVDDLDKKEELPSKDDQKPSTEKLCDVNKLLLNQKPMIEEQKPSETTEEHQMEVKDDTSLPKHTSIDLPATTDDQTENSKVEHESIVDKSSEVEQPPSKDKSLVKRKTSFRDKFFKKKQPSLNKQLSIDEQESKDKDPTLDKQNSTDEQPGESIGNQSAESVKNAEGKKSKKAEKSSKKNRESTAEEQDQPSDIDSLSTAKDQTSKQKKSLFKKQLSIEVQSKLVELITYEDAVTKIQEFIKLLTDMLEQNTSGQINPELCSQIYAILEELTPFFNDRLSIDLDKHLLKMKKALKKVNVDIDLPESSKRKQIFQTFFKYTKSGIFFDATMLYVRRLVSKLNENPDELSDVLSPLSDILSLEDKKDLEKEEAAVDEKKSLIEDNSEDKQSSIEKQTTGPESLTNEEAMSKIQELTKLATEMFEQNKSGQIEPELCTQLYAILQDLTPYFTEKLNIDLDKYLNKMKKSLKKDMSELDLPDSSKRKQIFTAIFKYTKSGLFFGTATLYIRKLIAKADETPGELSDALKLLSEIVSVENVAASVNPNFSFKLSKEADGEIGEGEGEEKKKEASEDEDQLKKTKTQKTKNRSKSAKSKDEQVKHTKKLQNQDYDAVELPKALLNLITPNKVAEDIELSPNENNDHISETRKCFNQIEGPESNKALDNSELTETDNDEGSIRLRAHQSELKPEQGEELKTENEEVDQQSVDEKTSKDKEESFTVQEESGPKQEDSSNEDNDAYKTKVRVEKIDELEDIKQDSENIEVSANENNAEEEQSRDKNEIPEPINLTKSNQKEQSDDEDQVFSPIVAQITPKLSKFKQMFTKPKQQQQSKPKGQTKKSENDQNDKKSEEILKGCNPMEGSADNKAQDNPEESGGINRFGNTTNFDDDKLNEVDNDGGSMGLGAHRSALDTEGNEELTLENDVQDQLSKYEDEEESNVDEEESVTEEEDGEDESDETNDSYDDSDDEFDSDVENFLDDFDSDDDDEEGKGHKVMSTLLKIAKKALNVALDLDI